MSRQILNNTLLPDVSAPFVNDAPRAQIGSFPAGQLDNIQQLWLRAKLSELFTSGEVATIYAASVEEFRKRYAEILNTEFGITGYVQTGRQKHKIVSQNQAYQAFKAAKETPVRGVLERNDTRHSFPVDYYKTDGFSPGDKFVNNAITMDRVMDETRKHLEGMYTTIRSVIRRAIYNPLTQVRYDAIVDLGQELPENLTIYPFYNGDPTLPIKSGANDSNYFIPGTHTHYLVGDMADEGFIEELIETVVHHNNPNVVLEIPQSYLPVIKTFTGRFTEALPDNTFVSGGFQPLLADARLNQMDRAMRSSRGSYMAGYFDGYQVWVISHGIGNPERAYLIARAILDGSDTNLYMRWSPVPDENDEGDMDWTNAFDLASPFPKPKISWKRTNGKRQMDCEMLIGCAPWAHHSIAVGLVEATPSLETYVTPETSGFLI